MNADKEVDSAGVKVLVVEDNAADRMLYRISLGNNPACTYQLIEAETGLQGLDLCRREKPECLLLDFMLPDITGLEFISALRDSSGALPCAVVMLTGIADERVAVQAMKEGATDYIAKSENVGSLLAHAIAAAIEKFRLQRQIAQSQLALAARERQYHTLLEAMPQLVWTANSQGTVEQANRRWVEYTGQPPGSPRPWDDFIHPDDYRQFQERWRQAVENGTVFEAEHRLRKAGDAGYRWHLARAVPMLTSDGVTGDGVTGEAGDVKWFGTCTDIDNQKEAERALQQRQKWESIGLLAGGIAHDFNNLLVGILGGASYVAELLPDNHPAQPMLATVVKASERAALLTRQMLAYAGKGRLFIEPVDLAPMVPETCELIQSSIPKNVRVEVELPPDLPPAHTDAGQMQQVVMNLILNAVESVPENQSGRVVVTAFAAAYGPQVDRDGDRDGEPSATRPLPAGSYIVLEVRDNGKGMDEETKSKIFDPFFTTKFTGRGLGLAAVQGIVRSSGGLITVESAPQKGSTFRVYLPAGHSAALAKGAGGDAPPQPGSNGPAGDAIILAIDDEQMVLDIVRNALEGRGAKVLTANDGESGIQTLREWGRKISLVVLDLGMPSMGGKEVLERMRAEGITAPVLISSGYSEQEVYRQLDALDVAGFLPKPFAASHLLNKVAAILHANAAATAAASVAECRGAVTTD